MWASSEEYAKDMEISKTSIDYARNIQSTDDWFERGMNVAKEIDCKGIVIHATVLKDNPVYIQKAHDIGVSIVSYGIEDTELIGKLKENGLDAYMSEKSK